MHSWIGTIRSHWRRDLFIAMSAFFMLPSFAFAGAFDAFFQAVKIDHVSVVEKLLLRGFDPNTIEDVRGDTGMILALREGSMSVFSLLLNASDINVEAKAFNGDTALMIAAYKGNIRAVKALRLFDKVVFHATTENEKQDIRKIFGEKVEIKTDNLRISKSNEVKPEIIKVKKQETEKREYKVKDYVVYPKHGVGQITEFKKINIGGIK